MTNSLYIVPDSNVWLSSQLLRSRLGSAVLLYCQTHSARIAFPEVVEREVLVNAQRMLSSHAETLMSCARQISNVMVGYEDEIDIPHEDDFLKSIVERIDELRPVLHRLPFTVVHARNALDKVLKESPPNAPKNPQFKDSAIWESLFDLPKGAKIHFISADKAFYKGRDTSQGLATELRQEATEKGLDVAIWPDLARCIESLTAEHPILDEPALARQLAEWWTPHGTSVANDKGYRHIRLESTTFIPVLVDASDTFPMRFEMEHSLTAPIDASSRIDPRATLIIRGETVYSKTRQCLIEATLQEDEFFTIDDQGFSSISNYTIFKKAKDEELQQ